VEITVPIPDAKRSPPEIPAVGESDLRFRYFVLEALNALATSYYFNYLFFYMRDHFGFGNRNNLMVTMLHGSVYACSAWNAGRFAQRHGHRFCLRLGFSGMCLALVLSGLTPRMFGYVHGTLAAQCGFLVLWTVSMSLTWPTLQAALSERQDPTGMLHTAGVYNVVWAGASAVAYFTGGALLEKFGGEILFWTSATIHVFQLILLALPARIIAFSSQYRASGKTASVPPLNPRPIAKARTFLYLAWLANPFAYIAINSMLPIIPKLSANLGLSDAWAGPVCSVWFWARLGAFVWCWLWPGWHYRFSWLFAAFLALAAGFTAILLSVNLWMLIAAQAAFGLAVGLIYYSSLFYSMDMGESQGKRGGFHEAAIGMGVFTGPAVGVVALYFLPHQSDAGIWAIGSTLLLGTIPFLLIKRNGKR
jgi:predicted MFS family arabinose efflux permease